MDEFELFRAQAYSGGILSSSSSASAAGTCSDRSSPHHLHENISPGAGKRRRHSSVALGQETSDGGDSSRHKHGHTRDRRHRLLAGISSQQHQSLDHYVGDDGVVANVTVAIEPPSPTETRRQLNITSSSIPSSTPSSSAAETAGETARRDDGADYDDGDEALKSDGKRRPTKSPLCRRVTSPEAVIRSSPQAEVTSQVGESVTQPVVEDDSESLDDNNSQSYRLALPEISGSSPGQQSRRSSMFADGNSLQPSSPGGSPRRNSHTGLVQSASSPPLAPPRPSSRRNSAVTYLPDMPQLRQRSGSTTTLKSEGRRTADELESPRAVDGSVVSGGEASETSASASALCGTDVCRVAVLGAPKVGKTTLARQLLTSEYLANKDNYHDCEDVDDTSVCCILLDDVESVVEVIDDHQAAQQAYYAEDADEGADSVDVFLMVYSVTDRQSFTYVQQCLQDVAKLRRRHVGLVVVANKQDLVRNRVVSTTEGKKLSSKRRCKFLEVSALLDHKVDEVLATIVRDARARRRRLHLNGSEELPPEQKGCLHLTTFSIFRKLFK